MLIIVQYYTYYTGVIYFIIAKKKNINIVFLLTCSIIYSYNILISQNNVIFTNTINYNMYI